MQLILSLALFFTIILIGDNIMRYQDMKDSFRNPIKYRSW